MSKISDEKKGYWEDLNNWEDIQELFEVDVDHPHEVILAILERDGDYEESIFIMYRNHNRYSIVHGYHCSCAGFEGQWDPEEYTKEEFKKCALKFEYLHGEGKKYLEEYIKNMK